MPRSSPGILRSLAPRHLPPARLLSVLNEQLQERKLDGQYVTMLLALWDDSTRTLCLANAGSVQPILVSSAGVSTINVEGFPLGLFPHATYDEMALPLASGDLVVFFSDGITDAVNATREQFGSGRLHALLEQLPATSGNAQSHRRCDRPGRRRPPGRRRALRRRNRNRAARPLGCPRTALFS